MQFLSYENVSLNYSAINVWNGLNLKINQGDFIGVFGPNGAGKSSFLKTILENNSIQSGKIVKKENISISYLPQETNSTITMPLRSIDLVKLNLDSKRNYVNNDEIIELFKSLKAESLIFRQFNDLSGGEKKKVKIAQMLIKKPELLLFDEPLANLDISSKKEIINIINQQFLNSNTSVILVSHDLNIVLPFCNKLLYFGANKYLFDTPENILNTQTLSNFYGIKVEVEDVKGQKIIISETDVI